MNGDDYRRVSAGRIALDFANEEERDPAIVLAMSDDDLLREAQATVERIHLADEEMDLPGGTILEIADDTRSAWIVNIWGGGYIAAQPPQEFLGPFSTRANADEALLDFGFYFPEDFTLAALPDIRTDLAKGNRCIAQAVKRNPSVGRRPDTTRPVVCAEHGVERIATGRP